MKRALHLHRVAVGVSGLIMSMLILETFSRVLLHCVETESAREKVWQMWLASSTSTQERRPGKWH